MAIRKDGEQIPLTPALLDPVSTGTGVLAQVKRGILAPGWTI
jgi:hypothetical protein